MRLAYGHAFHQHAAVSQLVNWSSINIQLYNFHTAWALLHTGPGSLLTELPKPTGSPSSQIVYHSWNRSLLSTIHIMLLCSLLQHVCWLLLHSILPTLLRKLSKHQPQALIAISCTTSVSSSKSKLHWLLDICSWVSTVHLALTNFPFRDHLAYM